MEKYACELHMEAKVDFKNWILSGKPKHGPEYEHITNKQILCLNMLCALFTEKRRP